MDTGDNIRQQSAYFRPLRAIPMTELKILSMSAVVQLCERFQRANFWGSGGERMLERLVLSPIGIICGRYDHSQGQCAGLPGNLGPRTCTQASLTMQS